MNRKLVFLSITFCLFLNPACRKKSDAQELEPQDVITQKLVEANARVQGTNQQDGWVISRWQNGEIEHQGDSLLWTGVAAGSLDCGEAQPFLQALVWKINETGGYLERFDPLPQEYRDRHDEITLDGEIGAMYGVAKYVERCGWNPELKDAWRKHAEWVNAHGGQLHPDSGAKLVADLDFPWDLLAESAGVKREKGWDKTKFEMAVTGWASGVVAAHEACYRIHLGFLSFLAADALGESPSSNARSSFCYITKNADIPLVDWWCGKLDPTNWLVGFEFDRWEYRHQRCGAWEAPDGKEGLQTPGLDFIIFHDLAQ